MWLGDDEILLTGNNFHFKITILGVDDVEFVDDGCDSLVGGFGEDDCADVVFVRETGGAEVHVGYVTYDCEAARDLVDFGR